MKETFRPNKFHCYFIIRSIIASVIVLLSLTGCYQAIQPDPNPPEVYILKYERNPDGTQGSLTKIDAGGQSTVPYNWVRKAAITVYGDSTHGVTQLEVTGTVTGDCSYVESSGVYAGQQHSFIGALGTLPPYLETAPSGTARQPMSFSPDPEVLLNAPCGMHNPGTGTGDVLYTVSDPNQWTIKAIAVNGSGLKTTGTFTIKIQY